LACKLIAGRPDKDYSDIAILRNLLHISTRDQAQEVVSRFFPDQEGQEFFDVSRNLDEIFGDEG